MSTSGIDYSRFPCCVLLALSWNTTNENPSTDKLSRTINYIDLDNDDRESLRRVTVCGGLRTGTIYHLPAVGWADGPQLSF